MNPMQKSNGLSARRKAIENKKPITNGFSRFLKRGTLLGILAATSVLISSCHEKTNGQDKENLQSKTTAARDSVDEPKVNIKVNRRYDDKGNLVGFDSTYTSFYSNMSADTAGMDSLMNSFDQYFKRDHSSLFNQHFNTLFFKDSLRYPDFFHNDFFMKRYELNDQYLKGMMRRMDSIKNNFYREHSRQKSDSKDL